MKFFLYIITLVILILFSSCSVLTKYSILIDKKSEKWERKGTCDHCESFGWFMSYDYKYNKSTNDKLSILVCPSLYGFTLSFGPPLVPVIPNPGLLIPHHWEKHPFFVDILFQNFKGRNVDLGSIEFILVKKNIELETDSIVLLSQRFERVEEEIGRQSISNKIYLIESDTTRLRFYFNAHRNKVRRLSIDFTKLKVNDSIVPFAKITYSKRSRFLYDPLIIGH